MHPLREHQLLLTRRHLLGRAATGIGTAALASLLNPQMFAAEGAARAKTGGSQGSLKVLHFAPKAKRVIYLFMSGGPSHIDLYDYKPKLAEYNGQELPASTRMGQRVTGMTAGQSSFPVARSIFNFKQHGKSGAWLSEAEKARYIEAWSQPGAVTGGLNYYRASPLYPPTAEDPGASAIRIDPVRVMVGAPTLVIWGDADAWLSGAKQNPGSWWSDWQQWVDKHGGGKVPARVPGKGKLKALEDAPGSYVSVRVDSKLSD